MQFRPRYSLLTLLLLTAGIAVGIKLWRGPHLEILSDPPNAIEATYLENFQGLTEFLKNHGVAIAFEVETLREWGERRVLSLTIRPTPLLEILHVPDQESDEVGVVTPVLAKEYEGELAQAYEQGECEKLLVIVHSGRASKLLSETPVPTRVATSNRPPSRRRSNKTFAENPLYGLTDKRRLYQLNAVYPGALVGVEKTLEQVMDDEVRHRIAVLLANIPN